MADLMIKLSTRLAKAVAEGGSPDSEALPRLISSYGARLGTPIGMLEGPDRYHRVEGVEVEKAEQLRRELEQLEGVEAAFIKPTDELP